MTAKIYLETYERLYRQAERIRDQIMELEAEATSIGAIRYDIDRVLSSPTDRLSEIVAKKVSLENVLLDTLDEAITLRDDMLKIFSSLPDLDEKIAVLTWLDFEGSIFIAQQLQVSRRTVFRKRHEIMAIVGKLIECHT